MELREQMIVVLPPTGIQSPEEQNQLGNIGNFVLGFCAVNNNKQSG